MSTDISLHIVPLDWDDAVRFVRMWHRHLEPPVGGKFWAGCADESGLLHGVHITGRPTSRVLQNGLTLEVTRCATDGTRNVSSKLYAAAWQVTKGLGFTRLITYNQEGETGASLKAAGFRVVAERSAHKGWNRPSRPREDKGSAGIARTLWEAV